MEIIWQAKLDNRYQCQVERINEVHGRLTMVDSENSETVLDQQVTLAWGAKFGADIDDIADWEERCVSIADGPQ